MLTSVTAEELLDVIRKVDRTSRMWGHVPAEDDLPGWTIAVLSLLCREGEQRLGRVAAHLEVDPSVVSRHVAALEQMGLVTRRPDPADRRAHLLAVSEAGLAALGDCREMRGRWVAEALAHWDDAEVAHLVTRLDQLIDDLHRAVTDRREPALRGTRQAS